MSNPFDKLNKTFNSGVSPDEERVFVRRVVLERNVVFVDGIPHKVYRDEYRLPRLSGVMGLEIPSHEYGVM